MTVPNVTYSRCVKVETALQADKSMASLLGDKQHIVHKPPPSNTPVKFSEVVIAITHALAEKGLDVGNMGKREIRGEAMDILDDFKQGKPLPKFDPVPAPEPAKPKPAPKPKVKAKAKPAEPKRRPVKPKAPAHNNNGPLVEPEGQPAPDPENPNKHMAEQLVLGQKETKPKLTAPSRVTAPVEAEPLPEPVLDDDARTATAGSLPYVWGVSLNSLVCSALNLLEHNGMGHSDLCKRLSECSNEIVKLTVIPRNAKESPSSPGRGTAP